MPCCGKSRSGSVNVVPPRNTPPARSPTSAAPSRPSPAPAGLSSPVKLRYLEKSPIVVRGPATGRQYDFSAVRPVQAVDVRDADALVRTRFFRRDG